MTVNPSIETKVLGVLRNFKEGASVSFVAQQLGLRPEDVASTLEKLYISSVVECRRLGMSIDVYRLPRWN
jgi:hypothetical protein